MRSQFTGICVCMCQRGPVPGEAQSNCICMGKNDLQIIPPPTFLKTSSLADIFVLDKNNMFLEKTNFLYPHKQTRSLFFWKKKVFLGNFFSNNLFFQNFKTFSTHKKILKIFFKFFRKKFSKKQSSCLSG